VECWSVAGAGEKRQFEAIRILMAGSPQLVEFLFDPGLPRLRQSPEQIVRNARGLSSGEYILVKLAVDIWCEQGQLLVSQLFELDSDNFNRALRALKHCLYQGGRTHGE
jgi:hypothetical protein